MNTLRQFAVLAALVAIVGFGTSGQMGMCTTVRPCAES